MNVESSSALKVDPSEETREDVPETAPTDTPKDVPKDVPKDKKKYVALIVFLHGIGILTSWNTYITAKDYFVNYKLSTEYTGKKLLYATYFLSFIGCAAQLPSLALNWINIFIRFGGSSTTRITCSLIVLVIIFLVTIVLAMMDTSANPGLFFWLTIMSIIIINSASGIYQSAFFGLVGCLPPKYFGLLMIGTNSCGLFTTLTSIVTNEVTKNKRWSGLLYFILGLIKLLLCFDTFYALPINKFYRYYVLLHANEVNKTDKNIKIPYWNIFKKAFLQLFNVFFVFLVSLVIFPAISSDIKASDKTFIVGEKYFTIITCYLTFNIFAMIGSLLTSAFKWPKPKYLIYFVLARVIFIPLFIMMNYHPKNRIRKMTVLIGNEWIYWTSVAAVAFSSGYFGALAMIYVPGTVEPQYTSTAGQFGSAMLVTGVVAGVLISFLGPVIVG